jgi:hypothetical protein
MPNFSPHQKYDIWIVSRNTFPSFLKVQYTNAQYSEARTSKLKNHFKMLLQIKVFDHLSFTDTEGYLLKLLFIAFFVH